MADRDWKSYMEVGAQFAESMRGEVERVLIELASEGKDAQQRAQSLAESFAEANRSRVDAFLSTVRSEVQKQVASLGIATQADLAALERRLKSAGAPAKKAPAKKAPAKKAPAKKAPAKKAPAKKAPAKKAPAKKAPAKKAPAKKAPVRK
jgi:DNA-binding protein HU-beta